MVAKALQVLPPTFLLGYDIGCTFQGTINNSSLGPSFRDAKCCCCVNAFHGYSHNFLCQLHFHPNIILGMGLEDLETLERTFSQSNALASLTRHMSSYRRRVFIDMFFRAWDDEKYQNLGTMLFNNYCQALDIINNDGVDLVLQLNALKLTTDDLDRFVVEQVNYFQELGKETQEDLHAIAYVELLEELRMTR
jgi:hypothetical protein